MVSATRATAVYAAAREVIGFLPPTYVQYPALPWDKVKQDAAKGALVQRRHEGHSGYRSRDGAAFLAGRAVLDEHRHVEAKTLPTRIFPDSNGARPLQGLVRA
jgi:hypothetical protein